MATKNTKNKSNKLISVSNNKSKTVNKKPIIKLANNKKTKVSKNKAIVGISKENSIPKKKKKSKIGVVINVILSLLMLLGIAIMGLIIAFCAYIVISAPEFDTDKLYNKEATIFYDKNGDEILRAGSEQREIKTYDELPEVLIDAIVATEDSRFFQHNGFDVVRFLKASFQQLGGNEDAGGASTLTMQVVKNTFTKNEDGTISSTGIKGIIRKFTDIYMAVFLVERNYTKEEIIEFYVNSQFLGQNTYGVEQACQKYFGKSVKDLTLSEAALIAGIFNSPSKYNPYYEDGTLATQRRETVLNLMVRHGYITEEQAEDANNISVQSLIEEPKSSELNKYQTFIDAVANEVKEKTGYDPYETPMLVYTTMDPDIQDVFVALNNGDLGYKWKTYSYMNGNDYIQFGGIVTSVEDGSILAINGGRNQTTARSYNRATEMKRQPGSTAKPIFAYGPYIEYNNGSPGTIFYDTKMTYSNGQSLKNSDGTYMGAITMRTALVKSRNIPAVQAFQAVDKDKISSFVQSLGIDYYQYNDDGTVKDYNLYESYAIGGGLNVSPEDMAGAYGAFARGGYYIEPYSFTKVIFQETDDVYETPTTKTQVMSAETAYMITDMLVTATEQGVGGSIKVSGTEIASKTGTSTYDYSAYNYYNVPDSASADNWVITYSPDYVISFWYGVDKLSSESYTDAIAAAIERKKISALLANKIYKKNSKFTKPSGIVTSTYEKETYPAQLPSEYTPSSLIGKDIFKKGTEPSEVSERFSKLSSPTNGGSSVTGTKITLTWTGISTPSAIDTSYLESYFTENYGDYAEYYLKKRLSYNSSKIGTLGYQVYLKTDDGETLLGYTQNTSYDYTATYNGEYTFIIRSAYSIFKSNKSDGMYITASVTDGIDETPADPVEETEPTEPTEPEENTAT